MDETKLKPGYSKLVFRQIIVDDGVNYYCFRQLEGDDDAQIFIVRPEALQDLEVSFRVAGRRNPSESNGHPPQGMSPNTWRNHYRYAMKLFVSWGGLKGFGLLPYRVHYFDIDGQEVDVRDAVEG